MSDTPLYLLVNLSITQVESYCSYEKGFFGMLKKYGGEFITYDDKPVTLEGDTPREGRMIIFKFPSEQAAKTGMPMKTIKPSVNTAERERSSSS